MRKVVLERLEGEPYDHELEREWRHDTARQGLGGPRFALLQNQTTPVQYIHLRAP